MTEDNNQKHIYIVISQTGTLLSRILKAITHRDYNHSSISLSHNLDIMYSFGRKNPYNPFFGGFVCESRNFGTFKRFSETKAIVLKLNISEQKYSAICNKLDNMVSNRKSYGYNYWGLFLAAFKIHIHSQNRYYCSEFVRDLLVECNIKGANNLSPIVHPMSFLDIPYAETVYCGKLKDYCLMEKTAQNIS